MQNFQNVILWLCRKARRVLIFVVGTTVLMIGIAMIVLPGPAVVVIPIGLAILATEFVWAKKWLEFAKRQLNSLASATIKPSQNDDRPSVP